MRTFQNIIHLDFEESMDCTGKVLKLIAESYPNLKYLNISALCNDQLAIHILAGFQVRPINDKGLYAIAKTCHNLEYLNISHRTAICELSYY